MSMISEQVRRLREFAKTLTYADEYNLIKGAADSIEELSGKLHASQMERSSQYYNGGWIPVTERLPEEGEIVLVTECNALGDDVRLSRWQGEAYGFTIGLVKAWMPLPEPWKGGKDG